MTGRMALLSMIAVVLAALQTPLEAAGPPLPAPDFQVDPSRWDPGRPARPPGSYDGPIIDTHVHLHAPRSGPIADRNLEAILAAAEEAGVRRLIFLPTPNQERSRNSSEGMRGMRRLYEMGGGRVGYHCGSDHLTVWMHFAYRDGYRTAELENRLARIEAEIENGPCPAIGEIGPYHFEKRRGQRVIRFPMNFEPFLRLAGLAVRLGVWMDLHAEPVTPAGESVEDQVFGGIALLFRRYPGLKLILAHTGMTNPGNARALLRAYPNLMMHLKITSRKNLSWANLGPIANPERELYEDWAALMEEMPERFMVGSDTQFWRATHRLVTPERYVRNVGRLRRLLGSLDPAAASLIAHGNAERLWPSPDR